MAQVEAPALNGHVVESGLTVMQATTPDFSWDDLVHDIKSGPRDTQEDRTRFLVYTDQAIALAAGYLPGQDEPDKTHYHTSVNVLTALDGKFYLSHPGTQKDVVFGPGESVVLPPFTPHYLRAMPEQPDGMGVLYIVAAPGMATGDPRYSNNVEAPIPPIARFTADRPPRGRIIGVNEANLTVPSVPLVPQPRGRRRG